MKAWLKYKHNVSGCANTPYQPIGRGVLKNLSSNERERSATTLCALNKCGEKQWFFHQGSLANQ